MTRPIREGAMLITEEIARHDEGLAGVIDSQALVGKILSLFPEGRSEQGQGGVELPYQESGGRLTLDERMARLRAASGALGRAGIAGHPLTIHRPGEMGFDLSALELALQDATKEVASARLRIKALETDLERRTTLPNAAVDELAASRDLMDATAALVGNALADQLQAQADRNRSAILSIGQDILAGRALLSSAQGETKEGFDGLPELPCGSRDEPGLGATAALAPMTAAEMLVKMEKGMLVFLDGRNEHGSHVLPSLPSDLPDSDSVGEALEEQAEQIISDAEAMGFIIGSHVWARFCWVREEYHHGHWEYEAIDPVLTRFFHSQQPGLDGIFPEDEAAPGATASPTPDTGNAKVAALVDPQPREEPSLLMRVGPGNSTQTKEG